MWTGTLSVLCYGLDVGTAMLLMFDSCSFKMARNCHLLNISMDPAGFYMFLHLNSLETNMLEMKTLFWVTLGQDFHWTHWISREQIRLGELKGCLEFRVAASALGCAFLADAGARLARLEWSSWWSDWQCTNGFFESANGLHSFTSLCMNGIEFLHHFRSDLIYVLWTDSAPESTNFDSCEFCRVCNPTSLDAFCDSSEWCSVESQDFIVKQLTYISGLLDRTFSLKDDIQKYITYM